MDLVFLIFCGFLALIFIIGFSYLTIRMFPPKDKKDLLYKFSESLKPKRKHKKK